MSETAQTPYNIRQADLEMRSGLGKLEPFYSSKL